MIANAGLSPLRGLAKLRDVRSRRFSSFDRTGGNDDRFHIPPGETVSIAETSGAGIVTHIWCTVACDSEHALARLYCEHSGMGNKIPAWNVRWGTFLEPATRSPATLSACLCK